MLAKKITAVFGEDLTGRVFTLWGLAFKPGTDDMREAPSIELVRELTERGAVIQAYDPQAIKTAQHFYLKGVKGIDYVDNKYDALNGADAMVVVTEWKEFQSPDFMEIAARMKGSHIFDGRNIYRAEIVAQHGLHYHQIGVR